jgi:uncharacterized lipoprotein YmbA
LKETRRLSLGERLFQMIKKTFLWITILSALGILSGCILPESNHIQPDFYILSPLADDSNESIPNDEVSFYLREIELPRYLKDPRLIFRPSANVIEFRETKRWGEPLADGIARVISLNIQNANSSSYFSIFPNRRKENLNWDLSIAFSSFEKVSDQINIEANWSAKHKSGKLISGLYAESFPLESEGNIVDEIHLFNQGLYQMALKIVQCLSES